MTYKLTMWVCDKCDMMALAPEHCIQCGKKMVRADFVRQPEWTTTPPTEPGMYQARSLVREDAQWVEVRQYSTGDLYAVSPGSAIDTSLLFFTHWLGPIPLADLPECDE